MTVLSLIVINIYLFWASIISWILTPTLKLMTSRNSLSTHLSRAVSSSVSATLFLYTSQYGWQFVHITFLLKCHVKLFSFRLPAHETSVWVVHAQIIYTYLMEYECFCKPSRKPKFNHLSKSIKSNRSLTKTQQQNPAFIDYKLTSNCHSLFTNKNLDR